jgi:hypothetical protein
MPLTGDHVVYMRLNKQLTAALIKIDATLGLNYLELFYYLEINGDF